MNPCYVLTESTPAAAQSELDNSFIGGRPKLPKGEPIPRCRLCDAEQSFFFQVAMPADNIWRGLSVAVFACTSCKDYDYVIPQMLDETVRAAGIPLGFLDAYQVNFRFLVFATADALVRPTYTEKVRFKRLELLPASGAHWGKDKIGGVPDWIQHDESPGTYGPDIPMFFLMQLCEGRTFELLPNAPGQIDLDRNDVPFRAEERSYSLFLGMTMFVFATSAREHPRVYAIAQMD
jgi:hypothetical protein